MKGSQVDSYGADRFSVDPSDVGQAVLRVAVVAIIVVWSFLRADGSATDAFFTSAHFQFAIAYLAISLALFRWTRYTANAKRLTHRTIVCTRVLGIFTDISAVSIYTALSGPEGIILYPIYLTSSIGYGYRFGVTYLYLALAVSAVSFSIVLQMNPFIGGNASLIVAFYLGIILVPIYAAILLRKHQQILERLKEVNAARSRFIANMSHEFRTPLHAIISLAELLREESDVSRDDRQGTSQKLLMISESGEHLLTLVNRVLDVASAESGLPTSRNLEAIELYPPILSGLRICQANAENKGIRFEWFIEVDAPFSLRSSAEMLKEIVINTVGNAVKYTLQGSVRVVISQCQMRETKAVRIAISDTGIGISPKLMPTIFEPFTLGDDSASRRFPGTGLGLTLTKKYIDYLGGTIEFDSRLPSGTLCTIELPIVDSEGRDYAGGLPTLEGIRGLVVYEDAERLGVLRRFFPDSSFETCSDFFIHPKRRVDDPRLVVLQISTASWASRCIELAKTTFDNAMLAYCDDSHPNLADMPGVNTYVDPNNPAHISKMLQMARAAIRFDTIEARPIGTKQTTCPIRILVADDNPTNLRTARLALQADGHDVTLVTSGEAALSELENSDYGLALIDLHMPNMSGIEVLQLYEYFLTSYRTPIVILTADVTDFSRDEALAVGAVAVLNKPLKISALRDAVRTHSSRLPHTDNQQPVEVSTPRTNSINDSYLVDPEVILEFIALGIARDEIDAMLEEFYEDTEVLIRCCTSAIARGDTEAASAHLHSLKGSCGTVGAVALMELIIEYRGRVEAGGHSIEPTEVEAKMLGLLDSSISRIRCVISEY